MVRAGPADVSVRPGAGLVHGEDGLATRREQAAAARKKYEESGEATTITVYSETDKDAANYARHWDSFRWVGDPDQHLTSLVGEMSVSSPVPPMVGGPLRVLRPPTEAGPHAR
ncbi:hypothetical protein [Streptomyces montanisoli]|uniref:Uncharacterized protein n=1 Tax=Streptomyces montanisoli TaxID=2798581 RepID=A0A940RYF3_9ACTN|nr:hypothetical protein [Streptomyces montanisoli]MBP0458619.1 hypothetical protein [Streptomyces montanisoli]